MAVVPTGYVFWDVSANRSYAAGSTMPTLGEGDYMLPATSSYDGYYHEYHYHETYSVCGIEISDGWYGFVMSGYASQTTHKLPFTSIGGKPVLGFNYNGARITTCPTTMNDGTTRNVSTMTNLKLLAFYKCTTLTTAPVMPTSVTTLQYCFYECASLTGLPSNIESLTNVEAMNYAFCGCTSLSFSSLDLSQFTSVQAMLGTFENCTSLDADITLPPNVQDIGWLFYGCTSLTTAPQIPSLVSSIYRAFYGCTSLAGVVVVGATNILTYGGAFTGTSNQIILMLSGSATLANLKNIAKDFGNVYAGVVATPLSFTAIRGEYDATTQTFTESVLGTYCKLTVSYEAPYVSGALLFEPITYQNGAIISPTWYISSLSGTALPSSGTQVLASGSLVTVINLGSSSTTASYTVNLPTEYTYGTLTNSYSSGIVSATLTYSNMLIDIDPTGVSMGIGAEATGTQSQLYIGWNVTVDSDVEATGDIKAGGDVTDGSGNVLSGMVSDVQSGGNSVVTGGVADIGVDFVLEQGTSGKWTYRRWNSGVVECWYRGTSTTTSLTSATGGGYQANFDVLTFPVTYTAIPMIWLQAARNSTDNGFFSCYAKNISTTGCNVNIARHFSANNMSIGIDAYVKGYI